MESHNHYEGIHSYTVGSIRHHARRLARSPGFLPDDVEDIEQEMMLHVYRQLPHHNPAKASLETFISRLIGNFAITLHRQAMTNGFGAIQMHSLHEPVQDEDGDMSDLIMLIPSDRSLWPDPGVAWHEDVENRLDAARILKRFSPSLRRLALLFMTESVTAISRSKGITRQIVYEALSKMRCMIEGAAKKNSDTSPTRCVCKRYEARKIASRRFSGCPA